MVINTEFKTCEEFEDYLYFNGLISAEKYVVFADDDALRWRVEFDSMDTVRCPDGKTEITFTKSFSDGEDYVTVNTEQIIALRDASDKVAWFDAVYQDKEKNTKILHFGVDKGRI
jgi:hypothetical protein